MDSKTFESENKVAIYPGKLNGWLLVRRKGAGPTPEKFVEEHLTEHVDTSMMFSSFPTPAIKKLSNDPKQIQLTLASYGRQLQSASLSKLSYPVSLGADLEYYFVLFFPPADAPAQIPWPLDGCTDKANWALSSALSDVEIATGAKSPPVNSGTATTPMTAADVEKQRQLSIDALMASGAGGGGGLMLEGKEIPSWAFLVAAGAVGLWYFKTRSASAAK